MPGLLEKVEKELKIPKKQLLEEGVKHFLEVELRNLSIEIKKLSGRYGVNSFRVYSLLAKIALSDFADIVEGTFSYPIKRLSL